MSRRSRIIVAFIACAVLILGVVGIACMLHQPNTNPAESDSEITVFTEPVSNIPEAEITEPENPDETEPSSEESTSVDEDSEWTTPIESDADGEESKSPDTLEETETTEPDTEEPNTGEPDTTEPETDVSEPSQDSCLDGGEHNYTSNTIQATCITEGKTVYTCAECGYSYAVTVSALGHTWGDWTTILEPSCSAEGHKERSCSSCGSIGTQTIETSPHEFSKYETVHKEEKAYIVSYCALCGAQNETITEGAFMSTDSGVQDEVFLWSVGRDFSFDVVCDQGIDYVKDRVTVLESNLQYASSDIINAEKEAIKVSKVSPNTWRVTSTSSLDENTRYWVSLEEDISFVDYPGQTLTFFTEGEEKEHVRYSSDILYLRELENASPGYYPYTYEYDTETEHAYVTVSKAGILDESLIGTLICVGECTDLNTVEGTKDGEVSVGKLESIQVRDGKTVLVLTAPSMLELFDELDIHSDRLTSLIENSISEEMQQDMVEQLIRSDGFAKVLAIQSTATRQYANEQGWDVAPLKISKDNFTFDPSTTQVRKADGSVAGVVVTIPVYFSYDDKIVTDGEVELGKAKFDAEFTLTLTFMLDCTTNFKQYLSFWNREDILKFDLTVVQNTEVNFKFSITIEMDYDYQEGLEKDDQEYLIHNPVSKVIHRESCRMAISLKDDPSNRKTYKDVYTIYEERAVDHECDWCQPITRDGSLFVKNTESGLYHCISCTHVNNMTRKENLILIKWLPFSTHDGIYCQDCKPQQYLKDFAQKLDEALKNGDWADAYEDIKKQLGNLFDEKGFVDASDAIDKKTEPILIIPDVFVIFELQIYFAPVIEFDFDATVNFEYNFYNQYIYTYQLVKEDKEYTIKGDISKGVIVDENGKPKQSGFTLDIKGKVEAKLGGEVMLKLNVWFADEWLYIAVGAEVGVYTELTGVLHIDNIKDDAVENYVAAYLEAGLYCELYCQFRVGPTGDKRMVLVPESKARLALIKAGNDRVYYGFETYDWDVIRIGNSGIYMLPQKLLEAKYLDLTNDFAKGSDTLSFAGGKDYRLVYKIVGSNALAQYVSIEDGVIRIHEEAPDSFEATILISVIEIEKEYSSFKEYYDEVIVKGQRSNSYHTGVLSIDIQFDRNRGEDEEPTEPEEPEEPVYSEGLSFISNGDGTCYVSGIGICSDLDVVIPPVSPAGDRVTGIDNNAFWWEKNMTSIIIPEGVTSIGIGAFQDCFELKCVVIPESVTSIGAGAFTHCCCLESIVIPDGVTSIGDDAFFSCTSLTSITVGGGVTSIGNDAFRYCWGVTSITIPDSVTSIGDYAFESCEELTSITIGSGVKSIGYNAFCGCTNLTSITVQEENFVYHSAGNCLIETQSKTLIQGCRNSVIPTDGSVTSIRDEAFRYCIGLTSITIGSGVKSIGYNAFRGCTDLTSITVQKGNLVYHSAGNCLIETRSKTLIHGCRNSVIPTDGSVTSIRDEAFRDCTSLTSITIPDSVTSIGDDAFRNCTSLTSTTVGGGVTNIGNGAFRYCSNLTSVTISDSVKNIGDCAFLGCTGLASITIGSNVRHIGNEAFRDCTSLTSITMPDSVTRIGDDAFSSCTGLTGITIGGGVTSIGDDAFSRCTSLTSITVGGGVTSIGNGAFRDCINLTSIAIPDSVKNIGDYAFRGCTGLTRITIGSNVKSIGDYAFRSCTGLTHVTICSNVKYIGKDVFRDCPNLASITIGSGVTSIGNSAFRYCISLTSITIPDSVTSIMDYAFYGCTGLTDIYFNGTKEQWYGISMKYGNDSVLKATIHCTDGDILLES